MNTNSYKYKEAERVSAIFNAVIMEMAAVLIEIYFMTIIFFVLARGQVNLLRYLTNESTTTSIVKIC